MASRFEGLMTPLTRALLEALEEGVVLFEQSGAMAYANAPGRVVLRKVGAEDTRRETLLPKLARLGSRVTPIWVGGEKVCEVVFIPASNEEDSGSTTLAERERETIITTLSETGWKLTESARRLGISRTTLWRRLRAYGIDRDHRARWSRTS